MRSTPEVSLPLRQTHLNFSPPPNLQRYQPSPLELESLSNYDFSSKINATETSVEKEFKKLTTDKEKFKAKDNLKYESARSYLKNIPEDLQTILCEVSLEEKGMEYEVLSHITPIYVIQNYPIEFKEKYIEFVYNFARNFPEFTNLLVVRDLLQNEQAFLDEEYSLEDELGTISQLNGNIFESNRILTWFDNYQQENSERDDDYLTDAFIHVVVACRGNYIISMVENNDEFETNIEVVSDINSYSWYTHNYYPGGGIVSIQRIW